MASSTSFSLLFLILLFGVPMTMGTFACVPVFGPLLPCFSSFMNPIGNKPSQLCCSGAAVVAAGARSYIGKAVVCHCLMSMMEGYPLVTPEKAHNVTTQCNVELLFPSSHANCSTV
uniref:Type X nonspecific lipid transfer protein LTPX03 n=1 Tax=Elaeis guineensis var. tenera TaxID=51953 RepID=A0A1D5AIW7_ELAGV|nr:type X nonspecific lipid transfer protein LTPX03 [Elaeis guineensis]